MMATNMFDSKYQPEMLSTAALEDIEKAARKLGRAYQCLRCFHRTGKEFIEVKSRMEANILRDHLRRDEVPFFCSLCQFRCLKRGELEEQIRNYNRH